MKHMKIIQIPATEKVVTDYITCDLCGGRINRKTFTVDEVTVEHRTGSESPEGGCGQTVAIDLCGKCFNGQLLPWLRSQGVTPQTKEWDY